MKKYISFAIALTMLASALTLGACGKKHTIDTDIALDGHESVSGGAGVIYQAVTDKNGEAVTDAEGETVTVAVTVPAEETTTAASGENNPSGVAEQTTKKGETTTKKNEASTKKNETTTKKNETTTKKNETTTKKNETTTKKQETTTQKPVTTTAAPATTAAPVVHIKDGEYVMTLSADKTSVSPGDTFTVTLNLKNCKNVNSFGMIVRAEGSLTAKTSRTNNSAEGIDLLINTEPEEGALIGGYFKNSYSFDDYNLCTITYEVSKDAVKGETLVLAAVPTQMKVGTGNGEGTEYADAMTVTPIMIPVN